MSSSPDVVFRADSSMQNLPDHVLRMQDPSAMNTSDAVVVDDKDTAGRAFTYPLVNGGKLVPAVDAAMQHQSLLVATCWIGPHNTQCWDPSIKRFRCVHVLEFCTWCWCRRWPFWWTDHMHTYTQVLLLR